MELLHYISVFVVIYATRFFVEEIYPAQLESRVTLRFLREFVCVLSQGSELDLQSTPVTITYLYRVYTGVIAHLLTFFTNFMGLPTSLWPC